MNDPLATYLNDHLGGAKVATELLEAMRDNKHDARLASFAGDLLPEVESDRDLLASIAEKIGAGSSVFKELGGWIGEKAMRMKLGQSGEDDFGTFQALEFLTMGVQGKAALWRALAVATVSDARLQGYDYPGLILRAEAQYAKGEEQRLHSAKMAFLKQGVRG